MLEFCSASDKKKLKIKMSHNVNVVKSRATPIVIPENATIPDLLWRNVKKWPEKIALECAETKRRYTYAQLHQKSSSLTRYLRHSPFVAYQSTVCILSPNIPEFPIIVIGCLQCGLKVTTLNPAYKSDEIKFQLSNSDTKLIFTIPKILPCLQKVLKDSGLSIPVVVLNFDDKFQESHSLIDFNEICSGPIGEPVEVDSKDVALMLYSSGTTGLPKGVELTHRNVVANLCQLSTREFGTYRDTTEHHQDVSLSIVPFFHGYGMVCCLFHPIIRGSKMITFPAFGLDLFRKLLGEYQPTIMKLVPSIASMILHDPRITREHFSRLRTVYFCGASLGAEDTKRILDQIGGKVDLIQAYGMTETCALLQQSNLLENGIKPGGSGLLLPNMEAKVVPIDGSSEVGLGPYVRGELLVRGPQVMKGYYKNSEATAQTIPNGEWLKTGDMVYYDEHDHFFITDRLKEMIKVKGFQVAPAELEEVLRGHPLVREAAVVGIPHPITGECPRAFVVLKEKGPSSSSVTEVQLMEFVDLKLVEYKRLTGGVVFIDEMPKNASGKMLKRILKEQDPRTTTFAVRNNNVKSNKWPFCKI